MEKYSLIIISFWPSHVACGVLFPCLFHFGPVYSFCLLAQFIHLFIISLFIHLAQFIHCLFVHWPSLFICLLFHFGPAMWHVAS